MTRLHTRDTFFDGDIWVTNEIFAKKVHGAVDVKSCGAKGDGTTDDTAAIQDAIDAATNKAVIFPGGNYVMGLVDISNPMAIIGLGKVRILLNGSNARFRWNADINKLEFHNIHVVGDGVLANNHCGFTPQLSGNNATDLLYNNCIAENCVIGFEVTGAIRATMINPKVIGTVGELSGEGYGIVGGGTLPSGNEAQDIFIICPYLYRTTRHAIYLGQFKRAQIVSPIFYQHRNGLTGNTERSALAISRGEHCIIDNPMFYNCGGQIMSFDDDDTVTGGAQWFVVNGGFSYLPQNDGGFIKINGNATADQNIKQVHINHFHMDCNVEDFPFRDIEIYDGVDVFINGVTFDGAKAFPSSRELIYVAGAGGTYTGAVTIANCRGRVTLGGGSASLVRIDDALATGTRELNIFNNHVTGLTLTDSISSGVLSSAVEVTNTNIRTDSLQEIHISGATPNVSVGRRFKMAQVGATNVTNFLGGKEGDEITIRFDDGNSTIKNTNIFTAGAVDDTPNQHDMRVYQYRGSGWREVSRSNN